MDGPTVQVFVLAVLLLLAVLMVFGTLLDAMLLLLVLRLGREIDEIWQRGMKDSLLLGIEEALRQLDALLTRIYRGES